MPNPEQRKLPGTDDANDGQGLPADKAPMYESEDINAAVVVEDNNINASVVVVESLQPPPPARSPVCLQEKIIFLVDTDIEVKELYTKKKTRLEVIKDCLSIFVEMKLNMPHHPSKRPEFSIYVLGENVGCFLKFTSNARDILSAISKIEAIGDSNGGPVDFSAICDLLQMKIYHMMEQDVLDSIYHIIFVFSRSTSVPTWPRHRRTHKNFLTHPNIVWDIYFVHTKSLDKNVQRKAKEVFLSLCDICDVSDMLNIDGTEHDKNKLPSYIFARSAGGHKLYLEFAFLMQHPALRDVQIMSESEAENGFH